jgi:dCMP deaminase
VALGTGTVAAMIFGVAGPNGAGKGEIVDYLASRSFSTFSLSDVIRSELARRGLDESRGLMIEVGRELRAQAGPGVLAERALDTIESDRNYAIDSIRHPAEIEVLRGSGQPFRLVWVDAGIDIRFDRLRRRGRTGDPETIELLEELEGRELGSPDPASQQLIAVKELADFEIANDGDLDSLHQSIRHVFERSLFFERPSWDEYFMSIAKTVASRSNCVKRKVAAVVTKDRRIISTGYNGTPRGTKNCNEGGCPRCNELSPGGARLDECLCSHGEENAITQAAYHGVSLHEATIYTTFSPCLHCTKMIINAGLREVVYCNDYPLGETSRDLLREAGIKVRQA